MDPQAAPAAIAAETVAAAPEPAPAPAPAALAPVPVCGCPVEPACTCQASLDHVKCVTMACAAGCSEQVCTTAPFVEHCGLIDEPDRCGSELDFLCNDHELTCQGKFHQAAHDVVGLTLNTEHLNDGALCGPHGKCMGNLALTADTHKAAAGTWLECVVPKNESASKLFMNDTAIALSYANQSATPGDSAWFHCSGLVHTIDPVNGTGVANCTLPMVEVLDVDVQLRGSCWISTGVGTEPLTQNAHFLVENRH